MVDQSKLWSNVLGRSACLIAALLAVSCLSAGTARAQFAPGWSPQMEISGTYSFMRANAAHGGPGFNVNGGTSSLACDFSSRLSGVVEVGAYHFSGLAAGVGSTMYSYLFGPRVALSGSGRVTPFAQILLGSGRLNASSGGIQAGENGFVMSIGGGLDVPFHRHFALRVFQADYFLTRFNNVNGLPAAQNNIRLSAGS